MNIAYQNKFITPKAGITMELNVCVIKKSHGYMLKHASLWLMDIIIEHIAE
jgi:hypothetical protein